MKDARRIRLALAVFGALAGAPAPAQDIPDLSFPDTAAPPAAAYAVNPIPREAPLPTLPTKPGSDVLGEVPGCQGHYLTVTHTLDRAAAIQACISELDGYFDGPMKVFASRMAEYRGTLTSLYNTVNSDRRYTYAQRQQFYQLVLAELHKAAPGGEHLDPYVTRETVVRTRREVLVRAFCLTVTCVGG
jgi:hypothetical protein